MLSNLRVAVKSASRGRALFSTALKYKAYGNPAEMLKYETLPTVDKNKLGASDIALKLLVAPINPSDLFQVQGQYGIQPALPAVGGNEGVAVVQKVGSGVKNLKEGDWVIPANRAFGTWQTEVVADESQVHKVPNDIPAPYAATLSVNPATAYRLLRDFEQLKPGDWIIQNAANSMVGYAVVQMAREMGVHTINIVRSDRPDPESIMELLHNMGGDINIADDFVNTADFNEILKDLPPIKLALNATGGPHVTEIARVLAPNATIVTYGAMSGKRVTVAPELLAYKQLKLKGFWMADWYKKHSAAERDAMFTDIAHQIREKQLDFYFELHDFDDFPYALSKAQESFYFRKVLLNMDFPDRLAEHDARPESDYEIWDAPMMPGSA